MANFCSMAWEAECCTPRPGVVRASERMRARDELSEELLLMLLAMGLSGLTTVNEELDLAWGLSLAASHAKGLCGTYRSLILSETVTGVLNGCFCCCWRFSTIIKHLFSVVVMLLNLVMIEPVSNICVGNCLTLMPKLITMISTS